MKSLQKSASAISSVVKRLRGWVTGYFVPEDLLAGDVLALQETAAEWDVSQFCWGVFPWQSSCSLAAAVCTSTLTLCTDADVDRLPMYHCQCAMQTSAS